MSLKSWIFTHLFDTDGDGTVHLSDQLADQYNNVAYKWMAINVCINFIASVVSLCDFETYRRGGLYRGQEHYRLNIEPNHNQSASAFWRSVVEHLTYEGAALVVKINGEYYVAESYTRREYAMRENEYTNVVIGTENPYTLADTFREHEVLYFNWQNPRVMAYIATVFDDMLDLIDAAKDNYLLLSRMKVLIKQDASTPQTPQAVRDIEDLVNNHLKNFLDPGKSAALPVRKGIQYEDVSRSGGATSSNAAAEYANYIGEGIRLTALAFQINPALLTGEVAGLGDAWKMTMTSCIKPLVNIISDEVNRKLYGYTGHQRGDRLFIDYTHIAYSDINNIAASLEALTRIRVNTLDDNLRALGRDPIGGEKGNERLVTKNYVLDDWLYTEDAQK